MGSFSFERFTSGTNSSSNGASDFAEILLAMGFTVAGCFLNSLSLILMKYSMEVEKRPKEISSGVMNVSETKNKS